MPGAGRGAFAVGMGMVPCKGQARAIRVQSPSPRMHPARAALCAQAVGAGQLPPKGLWRLWALLG
ncbi:hypothetical protein P7K49_001003 [Saguinus oedipus]|uniref:Uncharacterized protein n=1 Tax=Saguinus oedipus TaxID=9490 RepID=A0ABQ9WH14_SAGOE|nr:hypothetical protein P7K49_001003 [Saguinus oedipus]